MPTSNREKALFFFDLLSRGAGPIISPSKTEEAVSQDRGIAEKLRGKLKEKISVTDKQIEEESAPGVNLGPAPIRSALQPMNPGEDRITTGEPPVERIVQKVAGDMTADVLPLSPLELAAMYAFGKAGELGVVSFAKKFPNAVKILKTKVAFDKLPNVLKENPIASFFAKKTNVQVFDPIRVSRKGLAIPAGATDDILKAGGTPPDADILGQTLKHFDVTDDAKSTFNQFTKSFEPKMEEFKRGHMTFAQVQQGAKEIGISENELLKTLRSKSGKQLAERIVAGRQLMMNSLDDLMKVKADYLANPTDDALQAFTEKVSRHALIQATVKGQSSEIGRALSVHKANIQARTAVERATEDIFNALGDRKMIKGMAEQFAKIDPTDIAQANKFIRQWVKASTADKIFEFFINNILSGPPTFARNFVGNTTFTLMKPVEKGLKGGLDAIVTSGRRALGNKTAERTMFAGEAIPEIYGFFKSIPDAVTRGIKTFVSGVPQGQARLELSRAPAIPGKIGSVIRIPTRGLMAFDDFAKAVVGRMELSAQAYRAAKLKGLKGQSFIDEVAKLEANPTDEILEKVYAEQTLRTFQNRGGELATAFSGIRKVPLGRYVFPFVNTPSNILGKGLERSPFGFLQAAKRIAKGEGQEKVVDSLGNAILGSGITAAVAHYTLAGNMTGRPPSNKNERDAWFASGKKPYSFKVPLTNRWVSYQAEPLGITMGMAADIVTTAVEANRDPDQNLILAAVASVPLYLKDKSLLQGVSDVFEGITQGGNAVTRVAGRFASGFIPMSGFTRYIAQNMDPIIRDKSKFADHLKSNIPGLSKTLDPSRDVFGEPLKRDTDLTSKLLRSLGFQNGVVNIDAIREEDKALDRFSGFPAKRIGGVRLTDSEFNKMIKVSGRMTKMTREFLRKSPGFINAKDEDKISQIQKVEAAARITAKAMIYDDVYDRILTEETKQRDKLLNIPSLSKAHEATLSNRRNDLIEWGVENLGKSETELRMRVPQ